MVLTVFIVHGTEDMDIVSALYGILRQVGVTVHVSDLILSPGLEIQDRMRSLITSSDVVVAVLSKTGAKSEWVNWEIGQAQALHKPVIPVLVGDVDPPLFLRNVEYVRLDRSNPYSAYNNLSSYIQRIKGQKESNEALVAVAVILGVLFLAAVASE